MLNQIRKKQSRQSAKMNGRSLLSFYALMRQSMSEEKDFKPLTEVPQCKKQRDSQRCSPAYISLL